MGLKKVISNFQKCLRQELKIEFISVFKQELKRKFESEKIHKIHYFLSDSIQILSVYLAIHISQRLKSIENNVKNGISAAAL